MGIIMSRPQSPPRLYLDKKRRQWVIRDGAAFVRTGCVKGDTVAAQDQLARYIAEKHSPSSSDSPTIVDVLTAYAQEHLPDTLATNNAAYQVAALSEWWGDKWVSDINPQSCRDYASRKTPAAGRRDLETLRAAVNYWHNKRVKLTTVPTFWMPKKPEARDVWLKREEIASLVWAARRRPHLARFILIAYYTGSRSGVVLAMKWDQIDFEAGIMKRLAKGRSASKTKRAPPVRIGRRLLSHLRRWHRKVCSLPRL